METPLMTSEWCNDETYARQRKEFEAWGDVIKLHAAPGEDEILKTQFLKSVEDLLITARANALERAERFALNLVKDLGEAVDRYSRRRQNART